MKGRERMGFGLIFCLISVLFGCSGTRIYLLDIRYLSDQKAPPASVLATPKVVGICPFEDARKDKENIGVRRRTGNYVDLLRVEGTTVSEAVTRAVRDYFHGQGFKVTDCKGWNRTAEGLAQLPKDLTLVVGGRIDSFEVQADSGITTTETRYRVQIETLIGQIDKAQVVTRTIESTPQTKRMGFDPDEVKATLNKTLTEVLQNLFRGIP